MQPTYYLWSGVGEILDLDGEDGLPLCRTRDEALAALRGRNISISMDRDWTLWERTGDGARLLGCSVREGGGCRVHTLYI